MARRRGRAALAFLAAAAVLGAAEPKSEARRIEVGAFFDGGTVRLGRGDVLVVRLAPALPPATQWTLAFVDAAMLRPQGEPAIEDRTAVFRYVAAAAGRSSLGLAAVAPRDPAWTRLFRIAVEVSEAPPQSRTFALTEADDGSRISVAKGDVLTVRLPSNVTTGYGWSVAQAAPGIASGAGAAELSAAGGVAARGRRDADLHHPRKRQRRRMASARLSPSVREGRAPDSHLERLPRRGRRRRAGARALDQASRRRARVSRDSSSTRRVLSRLF